MVVHGIALDKFIQQKNARQGIIVDNGVEAYSGPFYGENAVLFRINEGTMADLYQSQEGWVEIMLIDGKTGWIPSDTIRLL
jgi:SH3-like domain-containing protein